MIDQAIITQIQDWIDEINAGTVWLPDDVLHVEGHSSAEVRLLLNRLVSIRKANYLEIGTHVGSTLIPAAYGNRKALVTAIDNFSLSPVWGGGNRVNDLFLNIGTFLKGQVVNFIESDCFQADLSLIPKDVNVYFYDGDHSYDAHYKAFTYFYPVFAKRFIAVVDDFNWQEPRDGTYHALRDKKIKIHHQWHLPAKTQRDEQEWWNGLFVGVLEKE